MPVNRYLLGAVAASAAVVAVAVWLPGAEAVLGTARLGAAETALVLGLAVVPAAVLEAAKAVARPPRPARTVGLRVGARRGGAGT
jgi:hypothetical protein